MKPEEERPVGKIRYEKPTAVDLGPTAPIVGASCTTGLRFDKGVCLDLGNSADVACGTGGAAVSECASPGNSAVNGCTIGYGATACYQGDDGTLP